MPLAPDQDAFEPELCIKCGKRADLRRRRSGTYAYWHCGISWVTLGSVMETFNELVVDNYDQCYNCEVDTSSGACVGCQYHRGE